MSSKLYKLITKEQEFESRKCTITTHLETDDYAEATEFMLDVPGAVIVYHKDFIQYVNALRKKEGLSAVEAINEANNTTMLNSLLAKRKEKQA